MVSVSGLLRDDDFPPRWQHIKNSPRTNYSWAVGGSAIVGPRGAYLAEPTFGQETILYADCPAHMIKAAKALFDAMGHYARPDVLRLQVRREPWAAGTVRPPAELPRDELRCISEMFEISQEKLAAIRRDEEAEPEESSGLPPARGAIPSL